MCMFLTFDTVQQIITIRSSQFHSETNAKCFHISRATYKGVRCVRSMKIHKTRLCRTNIITHAHNMNLSGIRKFRLCDKNVGIYRRVRARELGARATTLTMTTTYH